MTRGTDRLGLGLLVATCLLGLVGCGAPDADSSPRAVPVTTGVPGPPGGLTVPATTSTPSPVRPGQLTAAGVDPCALLTTDAQVELGVADSGPTTRADFNGATCRFVLDDRRQLNVTATDGATLTQLADESDRQGRTTTPLTLGGLAAVVSYSNDLPADCTVAVAVSTTGMVVVTYEDADATADDRDDLCGRATDVATSALDGLADQQ